MLKTTRLSKSEVYDLLIKCEKSFNPPLSVTMSSLERYSDKLSEFADFVLFVEAENTVGFAAFYTNEEGGFAYIPLIWVDEKHQHQGIGKRMIEKLAEKSTNIKKIRLEERKTNIKAIGFYRNMGFEVIEDRGEKYLVEKSL